MERDQHSGLYLIPSYLTATEGKYYATCMETIPTESKEDSIHALVQAARGNSLEILERCMQGSDTDYIFKLFYEFMIYITVLVQLDPFVAYGESDEIMNLWKLVQMDATTPLFQQYCKKIQRYCGSIQHMVIHPSHGALSLVLQSLNTIKEDILHEQDEYEVLFIPIFF